MSRLDMTPESDWAEERGIDTSYFRPFEIGSRWFIRSAVFHWVGEVVAVNERWLELKGASWVADSQRLGACIRGGFSEEAEIEFVGDAIIHLAVVIDAQPWLHDLPTKDQ